MIKTFKTFFKFIAENHIAYAVYILVVVAAAVLSSFTPYFYKLFVEAIPLQNYDILFRILLVYIGINFLTLIIGEVSFWMGNYVVIDAAIKLRSVVFAWVQDLDFVFHSNKSTGSLISAFKRGDNAFFDFAFTVHHRILDVLVNFVVMVYFFTRLNPAIALIVSIAMIATLVATKFLIENNVSKRNVFNDEEDKITDVITDNLLNYETVKIFAREKWEQNRLKEAFIPWRRRLWSFSNSYRVINLTIGTIINCGIFAVLLFSIQATTSLKMDIGDFVLVTAFVATIFPRLWEIVWSLRDIATNYSDIQKYFGLLDDVIEIKDPENPVKLENVRGEIEFKNVSHSYKDGTKNAICNFNLKIKVGESVAFVGKSGSGKTTITKLLMRFFDPTVGKILVDGINIKDFNKSDLRSFFGVVPQEPILFNNTIAYNIGYGFKGRTLKGGSEEGPTLSEIKRTSELANISEFIERLPNKYETNVGERGIKLSGGQKQRLAIARMILSKPDVVIFDEATSHLDSESEKLIQESFWKEAKGKTTIVIAHRLSTIAKADKIIVMEKGMIREIGTHEELLKNKESLYSHFWNLQIKLD